MDSNIHITKQLAKGQVVWLRKDSLLIMNEWIDTKMADTWVSKACPMTR